MFGTTDVHSKNFHFVSCGEGGFQISRFLDFLIPAFPDFQNPAFPDFQTGSRAGGGRADRWAGVWNVHARTECEM